MKTLNSLIPLAALTALIFAGCSKQDRNEATTAVKDAYNNSKTAVSNAWDDVKSFSFDKRDEFTKSAKALSSRWDSQVSELRANYSEAKASASRKVAMAELKASEIDYHEKLDALGQATSDTWESAKQKTIAAWDRMQAAYYKARAD